MVFALVAFAICWRAQYVAHALGGDHLMIWRAAHIVLDGGDPYKLMWPMELPALHTAFNYPLPAIGMGLPFVWLRQQDAAIAFATCSAALLGFVLTKNDLSRVPLLLSVPFWFTAQLAQTSALILAFALVPEAGALTAMKPNIGLALFAWRPMWRTAILGGAFVLGTVIISPQWLPQWLHLTEISPTHHAPVRSLIGALPLLAVVRWRRPEARLLVAMTLIPHGLYFYDELPLWLVARTQTESILLAGLSWLGWLGWLAASDGRLGQAAPWIIASLYIPCLVMILRRPNEGEAPEFVSRIVERFQ